MSVEFCQADADHRMDHDTEVPSSAPASPGVARRLLLADPPASCRSKPIGLPQHQCSAAMFMESYGTDDPAADARQPRLLRELRRRASPPRCCSRQRRCNAEKRLASATCSMRWRPKLQPTRSAAPALGRQALARVPVLRPEQADGALLDPDAADIDVNTLHQGLPAPREGERRAADHRCVVFAHAARRHLDRRQRGGEWRAPHRRRRRRLGRAVRRAGRPTGHRPAAPSAAPPSCFHRQPAWTQHAGPASAASMKLVFQARCRPAAQLAGQCRPGRAAGRAAGGTRHRAGHRPHRGDDHARHPPPQPHLGRAAQSRGRWRPGRRLRPAGGRASSGAPRKAFTASRPRRPWVNCAGPGCAATDARAHRRPGCGCAYLHVRRLRLHRSPERNPTMSKDHRIAVIPGDGYRQGSDARACARSKPSARATPSASTEARQMGQLRLVCAARPDDAGRLVRAAAPMDAIYFSAVGWPATVPTMSRCGLAP